MYKCSKLVLEIYGEFLFLFISRWYGRLSVENCNAPILASHQLFFWFFFAFFYNNTLWNEFKTHQIFHIVWITKFIETKPDIHSFMKIYCFFLLVKEHFLRERENTCGVENSSKVHIRCALLVKLNCIRSTLNLLDFSNAICNAQCISTEKFN